MSDSKKRTQKTLFQFLKADVERPKSQTDVMDDAKSTSSAALPDDNPTPGPSSANTEARIYIDATEPNQPRSHDFPFKLMGGKQRRFQPRWFDRYPWLYYDTCSDSVRCHACMKANKITALSASKANAAFITKGFDNWKKALTKDGFVGHELSQAHREAVLRTVEAPSSQYGNVGVSLSEGFLYDQVKNRRMLMMILSNVRMLGNYTISV